MLVYISGQLVESLSTPQLSDADQWKENVEDWAQYLFGLPKDAWQLGDIKADGDTSAVHEIAVTISQMVGDVLKELGKMFLHIAPDLLLVVCMACILGMMIGSNRCKHWAGVAALATLITKVVGVYAGV